MGTTARTGRGKAMAVGAVVLVAAFAWLLYGGIDSNVVYFLTPKELQAKGTKAYDKPVRLGGQVKPGSVNWNETTRDLRFELVDLDGVSTVRVQSKGAPPQMFRDGMGVVVEGRYGRDGVFQSTNLMIKHSEEYKAPKDGQMPKEMYKSLMQGQGKGA